MAPFAGDQMRGRCPVRVIDHQRIGLPLGIVLASVAGMLLGSIYVAQPTIGGLVSLKAFVVVIFGGMGSFPAAEWAEQDLLANYGVERLAPCEGVTEHFFAVGTEKKVQHPLVQRVLDGIA